MGEISDLYTKRELVEMTLLGINVPMDRNIFLEGVDCQGNGKKKTPKICEQCKKLSFYGKKKLPCEARREPPNLLDAGGLQRAFGINA